jgi:hypothetical protein
MHSKGTSLKTGRENSGQPAVAQMLRRPVQVSPVAFRHEQISQPRVSEGEP